MSETILKVQHLGKSFGNNEILKDIDFSVKPRMLPVSLALPVPVNLRCCAA